MSHMFVTNLAFLEAKMLGSAPLFFTIIPLCCLYFCLSDDTFGVQRARVPLSMC